MEDIMSQQEEIKCKFNYNMKEKNNKIIVEIETKIGRSAREKDCRQLNKIHGRQI